MARLIKVVCPRCGAGLQLDPSADFTTCAYCGTSSYVKKPASQQGPAAPPPPVDYPVIDISAAVARGARTLYSVIMSVVVIGVATSAAVGFGALHSFGDVTKSFEIARQVATQASAPIVIDGPLIGDANGDTVDDVLVVTQTSGSGGTFRHFTAIDALTGKELWTSDALGTSGDSFVVGSIGKTALVSKLSSLYGYDLRTGKRSFERTLPERVDRFCDGGGGVASLVTKDSRVYGVDLATGELSSKGKLRQDGTPPYKRADLTRWPPSVRKRFEQRIVDWEQERAGEVPCYPASAGGWRSYGTAVQESRSIDVSIEGMSVSRLLRERDRGPYVVIGSKQPGTRVPMLAAVDENARTLWKVELPSKDPMTAKEGDPEAVAMGNRRVAAAFEREGDKQLVLAVFELTSGRRVWEVNLKGEDMGSPIIGLTSRHLFLKDGWTLRAFGLVEGKELWKYGRAR